ncbi:hypothetical protein BDV93DRAFT_358215 [Ceratobasidium sp. AG-I]|nr:hypothetical protein BDV93DRAFT_358215 [Ceratobasidium sp. AG-I]
MQVLLVEEGRHDASLQGPTSQDIEHDCPYTFSFPSFAFLFCSLSYFVFFPISFSYSLCHVFFLVHIPFMLCSGCFLRIHRLCSSDHSHYPVSCCILWTFQTFQADEPHV